MQRRVRVRKAAARLVGGHGEIAGVEKGIDLPQLLAVDDAGVDADRLLIGDVLAQPIFVLWGDDLNEPDGAEGGRAGADFLIPVAKDAQAFVRESRLRHVRVVAANEGARFPGRAGPEMATLEDDDVSHTTLRQLECGR